MNTLYASSKTFTSGTVKKINNLLLQNSAYSNVYPLDSIVYDKKAKKNRLEHGYKIDIFEIDNISLFKLYHNMVDALGINCIWVDTEKYHGCISKMQGYGEYCKKGTHTQMSCSMYD